MPNSDAAESSVETAGQSPRRVTVDGNTAESHPLKDQLDVADRVAANQFAKKPRRGLAFAKIKPGGTV